MDEPFDVKGSVLYLVGIIILMYGFTKLNLVIGIITVNYWFINFNLIC